MKKTIKLLSFLFILTFAITSCGNDDKECKHEDKKECCEGKDKKECTDKDKEACEADCKKECCADKDKEACEADCKKECCADKAEASDSTATTEVSGDETAHTCTQACQDDPHSCPNHEH
ncbi:MAG: hypothetical protein KJP21_09495 [Bacteroidia bacterium]|nr:hypothetical protein [Bacteroidia bacterium]NNJ54851.1 hypothetical protein [Bacteroidia bacterium]